MIRKLFFVLLLSCVALSVNAGDDRALLWKVTHGDATVYLMGSIHYADDSFYPLRDTIQRAFEQSDNLVVEVDMSASDLVRYQQLIATEGMYEGNETIRDHVSAKTYDLLLRQLRKLDVPLELVQKQKPGVIVLTLTSVQAVQLGFDPQKGIDAWFIGQARGKKKIIPLETIEQQVRIFLDVPDSELLLQESLRSMDEADQMVREMMTMWKRGDADALERLLFEDTLRDYPSFASVYDALFYRRNRTMTSAIRRFLESDEKYFVVVGAGHLVGEQGIVNLLRQAGYTFKRL